jgi:predicted porin
MVLATSIFLMMPFSALAQPAGIDPQLFQQMQDTIRQQQEQLRQQAEQIRQQFQKLESMQQQIDAFRQPSTGVTAADPPPATGADSILKSVLPTAITAGNDKVRLSISGQINRAVTVVNDGYNNTVYHVDNDAGNSRIRFVGTVKPNDDLTIGTRIEVAIAPDLSSQVSQNNKTSGDYFSQRWADISFDSKMFGRLSVGKGDTASNNSAEVDLSKTDVILYSGISDMGGGMLFRDRNGRRPLTSLKVSDVFNNFDGLSRKSRLRYDTPSLLGFRLAGSLITNQRSDVSIIWDGEGYGFQAEGAFAVADPKLDKTGLQYDGSFSLLHTKTGVNLTVSGGLQERSNQKNSTNLYTKLGWIAKFTDLGTTAFGVDYTHSANLPSSNDKGYSVGGAVVQTFDKIATELYLQYRIFNLDCGSGGPVANMNMGTFGARVKF